MMKDQAGDEAKKLTIELLKPIKDYQDKQGDPGRAHVMVILAALAFVVAVIIARLPRQHYRDAHDWFQDNLKKAVDDIR